MTELRVDIPDEMSQNMKMFVGINWELMMRRLLKNELERMARLKRIVSKSKMTEKDATRLAKEVNEALAERFMESLKE